MSKRRQELLKEAENLEEQSKRLKQETLELKDYESVIELLDRDLNAWRCHLVEHASPSQGAWKLMFWSEDYEGGLQSMSYGYAPSIETEVPWSIEKYFSTKQNAGPELVAYADNPRVLFHPDRYSRIRLESARLVYFICPSDTKIGQGFQRAEAEKKHWKYLRGLYPRWDRRVSLKDAPGESHKRLLSESFLDEWEKEMQDHRRKKLDYELEAQHKKIAEAQAIIDKAVHDLELLEPSA